MIGIYKITSPTNKIYIGQSLDIEKRFVNYKGLFCKQQTKLYNSLLKYGVDNHKFEILEECSVDLLNERERYYQDYYNVLSVNGLNCWLTKTNDKSGLLSNEIKQKMSISRIGNKNKLGFKHNDSFKQKRSEIMKGNKNTLGFKHNERSKAKMSKNSAKKLLVLDKETGVFYNSIVEVANLYNLKSNTLAMKLKEYGNKKNNTNFILV